MKSTRVLAALGLAILSTAFATSARATTFPDLTYNITLNLSSLHLDSNSPFSLDFALVTGSGAANVINTVTLSNFVFTGGTAGATTYSTTNSSAGSVTGSVGGSLILTTGPTPVAQTDNEIALALSSGVTQVTFHVDQTPNSQLVSSGTPVPDQFNVAILDSNLNNVQTTDPSGAANDTYTLVSSAISESETAAQVNQYTLVAPTPTPEPSTYATLLAGLVALGVALRRRARRA
jgi:hypothetical protein